MIWGSVAHHELTLKPTPDKRRRCRWCPAKPRRASTHIGCANGVAMTSGCEWHMYVWLRNTLQARREGKL